MLATLSHMATSSHRYIFPHYRRYIMGILEVPRPNVDENQRSSFVYDTACLYTRPKIFSHKLLSKSFEIKPQLMMAAATGLPSVGFKTWCACRQSECIGCSTIREVTNLLITKKPTDYRPSVPGPTYLEHCFFYHLQNVFYAVGNIIQTICSTFS